MFTYRNYLNVCLIAGAGVAAGALGVLSLTQKNNSGLRKTCVSLLSRGLDLKDKIGVATEVAKESVEDILAEARYESHARKIDVEMESEQGEVAAIKTSKPAKKTKAVKKTTAKRASSKTV